MGRVVVDVMPKPEILDPQGKAVAGALPRLGFGQFTNVRQGKRFELEVEGDVTPDVLAAAQEAAETVLSNPVIEDVVRVADIEADAAATAGSTTAASTGPAL
ncbi:phosphoribosylformylglycinamidine synthase subunit PurS [Cellulomonas fimi]|uniref:Phosphoribosylformylglycinamidine synthase subunit PurS n=1 Tax=Cellulomonas fimi TaxID=1708 RepID=A0A7Y0LYG1_CELFI|nr:phosphoribosylformylglycinamidine synthase subunit PurS [Cellulomonas fimi]NMR19693.1 phosphoribosylformylglycinamidine synthase subunit PurS [Cellulomonas fimi]